MRLHVLAILMLITSGNTALAQTPPHTSDTTAGSMPSYSGTPIDATAYNAMVDRVGDAVMCADDCDRVARLISGYTPLVPMEPDGQTPMTGEVAILFVIDEEGSPSGFLVERATSATLATYAVAALQTWQFEPALKDGHPVKMRARQIFPFVTE